MSYLHSFLIMLFIIYILNLVQLWMIVRSETPSTFITTYFQYHLIAKYFLWHSMLLRKNPIFFHTKLNNTRRYTSVILEAKMTRHGFLVFINLKLLVCNLTISSHLILLCYYYYYIIINIQWIINKLVQIFY